MNPYLEKLDSHLGNIQRSARDESDPHRSTILWNYLFHGAFEVGGDWERIFTPKMIVDDPHYEMRTDTEDMRPLVLDGSDAVQEFYGLVEGEKLMLIDDGNHQLFVNDDGLAEFATTVEFTTGRAIVDDGLEKWYYRGAEVDDPDAPYVKRCRHAMFWPYTEDGRLVGEMVYQLEPFDVVPINPGDVPTLNDIQAVAERYYPERVRERLPEGAIDDRFSP